MASRSPCATIRPTQSLRPPAHAARDAADRGQSALGARRDARSARAAAARRRAPPPLSPRRRDSPMKMSRSVPRIGEHGLAADPQDRGAQAGRAGQYPHPLQRRLARDGRLGHRAPRRSTRRMTPAFALHVWVDETRPRNQGASLTAWELGQHGVPHTVIVDNAGGHLMQHGDDRSRASSAPTAPPRRRRLQQDRHLSEGARGQGQRRSVLSSPRRRPRSTSRSTTA